jgi:hypothetical protein
MLRAADSQIQKISRALPFSSSLLLLCGHVSSQKRPQRKTKKATGLRGIIQLSF